MGANWLQLNEAESFWLGAFLSAFVAFLLFFASSFKRIIFSRSSSSEIRSNFASIPTDVGYLLSKIQDALPVSHHQGIWSLVTCCAGCRVWRHDHSKHDLYAGSVKTRGPVESLLSRLREGTLEWMANVLQVQQLAGETVCKVRGVECQHDVIGIENELFDSVDVWNKFAKIERWWRLEKEHNIAWLLNVQRRTRTWNIVLCEPLDSSFSFSECRVTFVLSPGIGDSDPVESLAASLSAIAQCLTVAAPDPNEYRPPRLLGNPYMLDNPNGLGGNGSEKGDTTLMQRVKHLFEEKKEWLEEMKTRSHENRAAAATTTTAAADARDDDCGCGDGRDDGVQLRPSHQAPSPQNDPDHSAVKPPSPEVPCTSVVKERKFLNRWMERALNHPVDPRVRALIRRVTSSDGEDTSRGIELKEEDWLPKYEQEAETIADVLLRTKSHVASLDVTQSSADQANHSGGWTYCGLERDVVTLRKTFGDDSCLQSFLGKGLVDASPEVLAEIVANPHSRISYDDSIKKVEVLRDYGRIKVVHMVQEVSELKTNDIRESVVLLATVERPPRVLSVLGSVAFPKIGGMGEHNQIKYLESGWIFEPIQYTEKQKTMVTYITQMELQTSDSRPLVYHFASRQPSCVANLRDFLVPTPGARSPTCDEQALPSVATKTSAQLQLVQSKVPRF